MDVAEARGAIPYEISESLAARGIRSFTEPQELALRAGLMDGRSMVVASPTASGKTLVAEMACASSVIAKGKKALYIAPMRALVSEKYREFMEAYPFVKTVMSVGDLDSNDQWLSRYEMVFVSTEKLDSLMRHGIEWLGDVGCIVFDEIHMLGDPSRGPTLELLITKLRSVSGAQMIALSATIGNANEIAKWMGAELVESDYRPIKLKKGIVYEGKVHYAAEKQGKEKWEVERLQARSGIPETQVVEDTLNRKKQLIIFYSSRRNAEAGAARVAPHVRALLTETERSELEKLSGRVLHVLDSPTQQCTKLAGLVKDGVAFHHAGLMNAQRSMVEEACRGNLIKAVCSTTTLGLGVNLPAHTVLVRDIHRYDGGGSAAIGANEVMQLFGRAGRPKYDTEGRALLVAQSKESMELLSKRYMKAKPEPVDSGIGIAPVLRTHILAFIAEDFLNTKQAIDSFLAKTFYGFQYRNMSDIRYKIESILRELISWDFVSQEGEAFYATRLGKRVSELYIDPLSARQIATSLGHERDLMGNLFMLCNTLEMRPYVKATEEALAGYVMMSRRDQMPMNNDAETYGAYEPERAYGTALMLRDWMDEKKESAIVEAYSTTPGFIYNKLNNAEWLAYSAMEMAKILHVGTHDLINMNARLKYGIREELLDLVRLRGIGRARARLLFANGIETVKAIKNDRDKVVRLLGREVAQAVFDQL